MKQDIILAGVGGQGILSIAYVIDKAALKQGFQFKQAEVHGMAQRGGAVQSHLRIADPPVFSELIPKGEADLLLSVEPLETLRYLEYLKPKGTVLSSINPFLNIPDYPPLADILEKIRFFPQAFLIDSEKLSRKAGSLRSQNMVMLGAASCFLAVKEEILLKYIEKLFSSKGKSIVEMNLKAFRLGRDAVSG
ncbi:MAG: indolepyruvate oxidoreductase subunit beta [Acidobacteriota bacterium]